jgi:bacterioferritin-associated ferredoxin
MVISMLNLAICGECTFPDLAMCVGLGSNCGATVEQLPDPSKIIPQKKNYLQLQHTATWHPRSPRQGEL